MPFRYLIYVDQRRSIVALQEGTIGEYARRESTRSVCSRDTLEHIFVIIRGGQGRGKEVRKAAARAVRPTWLVSIGVVRVSLDFRSTGSRHHVVFRLKSSTPSTPPIFFIVFPSITAPLVNRCLWEVHFYYDTVFLVPVFQNTKFRGLLTEYLLLRLRWGGFFIWRFYSPSRSPFSWTWLPWH